MMAAINDGNGYDGGGDDGEDTFDWTCKILSIVKIGFKYPFIKK